MFERLALSAVTVGGMCLPSLAGRLHCESDFNRDLVMPDRTIFDVTADLSDLDPPQIPQCLAGFANGFLDCIFNALR